MYYGGKYYRSEPYNKYNNFKTAEELLKEIKPIEVRRKELLESSINAKREKIERLEKLIEHHKKGINCDIEVLRAYYVTEIARIEKELEPLRFQLEDLLRKKRGGQIYG